MALKCADLGHLAAPWAVHQNWVAGLEEELFRQGDNEKQAHMPVSPLMDRTKGGITKSQVSPTDRHLRQALCDHHTNESLCRPWSENHA